MYAVNYDLEGVKGGEAFQNLPVETLSEAMLLVEERCKVLLGVSGVGLVVMEGNEFWVYVGFSMRGTVRIRRL